MKQIIQSKQQLQFKKVDFYSPYEQDTEERLTSMKSFKTRN
jgi:hypothetical protein